MTTGTFTEQDTQTFATKLEAFSQTLTTGEQAILTLIEQQLGTLTTTDTDDVQGYMLDQIDVALARQRELLHEADRLRPAARANQGQADTQTESRASLWSRIALTLGQQANAMSPRVTGQPATG